MTTHYKFRSQDPGPALVIAAVLAALVFGAGSLALTAAVLSAVLGALGVGLGFWPSAGLVFLFGAFVGTVRK
jgi:hypothetical protein